jgi:hypothetical protein
VYAIVILLDLIATSTAFQRRFQPGVDWTGDRRHPEIEISRLFVVVTVTLHRCLLGTLLCLLWCCTLRLFSPSCRLPDIQQGRGQRKTPFSNRLGGLTRNPNPMSSHPLIHLQTQTHTLSLEPNINFLFGVLSDGIMLYDASFTHLLW